MPRTNRGRKRTAKMNQIKRERNAKKELIRLKKTLGLLDENGREILKECAEVVTVKTAKEIQEEQEERELQAEMADEKDQGENVEVVNENSGKKHIYNTKTMKDQFGCYPPWYNARRHSEKKKRRLEHFRKKNFRQAWCTTIVPL